MNRNIYILRGVCGWFVVKKVNFKKLGYDALLRCRRELGVKVAISSGKEYKESLQELFDVREEIERRKRL